MRFIRHLRSLQWLFSPLLVAGFLAWAAIYLHNHAADLKVLSSLSFNWLLLLFGLSVIKLACMGLITKVMIGSLGIGLGVLEWFGLSAISAMGNYLTPFRGGAAIRGIYLKSRHGLPYLLFLSTLSILYVITFATNAALGLLAVFALYLWFGFINGAMILFFLFCLSLPVLLFSLVRVVPRLPGRWMESVNKVIAGWRTISAHPGTLVRLTGLSVLNASVTLLIIHFSFAVFGTRLPLLKSLVLSSLFLISAMIPVTPAGLGIAEVMLATASRSFGVEASLGVFSAGLNRSVMILSSLLWGSLFSYILGRRAVPAMASDSVEDTGSHTLGEWEI